MTLLIGTPLPSERRKALEHSPKHERDPILEHLSIYMQGNKSPNHRVAICPFSHVGFLVPFERLQLHPRRSKFVSLLSLMRLIHVKSRDPPVFSSFGQYPHARAKNSHQSKNKYNPYCHLHADYLLCLALETQSLLIVRPAVVTLRCLLVYCLLLYTTSTSPSLSGLRQPHAFY